jgi:hypothetical protein
MWHTEPKNDAWREVHLAHVESLGNRLWLRCNACGHSMTPEPCAFAAEHHLDMQTPLLLIARRLKCTRCNERKAHCWPEPYGIELNARLLDESERRIETAYGVIGAVVVLAPTKGH